MIQITKFEIQIRSQTSDGGAIVFTVGDQITIEIKSINGINNEPRTDVRVSKEDMLEAIKVLEGAL